MTSDASDNCETSQTPRQPADADELRVEFDVDAALEDIEATPEDVDAADVFILDESTMVRPVDHDDRPRTPCPVCGEVILNIARVCRYCGEEFESPLAPPISTTADTWERPVNPFGPDNFELDETDSDQGAGVPHIEFDVNAVLGELGVDSTEPHSDDLLILSADQVEHTRESIEAQVALSRFLDEPDPQDEHTRHRRPCVKCGQMIAMHAIMCRFCGARGTSTRTDPLHIKREGSADSKWHHVFLGTCVLVGTVMAIYAVSGAMRQRLSRHAGHDTAYWEFAIDAFMPTGVVVLGGFPR